jgi:hypothetical protein
MKRQLNTFLWHYFATVLRNDVGKICLVSAAIIISEIEDAYKFLIQSILKLVQGHRNVLCVAGDDYFNKNSLKRWGLPNV